MRCIFTLFILLIVAHSYAQYERIITYPSGKTEYIVNFENDVVQKTICISPNGDTIYSWDLQKTVFNDYPVTGIYLTPNEYKAFKQQLFAKHNINSKDTPIALNELTPPAPTISEWKMMHEHFFNEVPKYTLIIHEGEFTIVTDYENKIQQGSFKKYYHGLLVVNGQYENGERTGLWTYHPYPYYPYDDIEIVNIFGRDYSILYYLFPSLLLIIVLIIAGRMTIKNDVYHLFFYIVMLFAAIALILRLYLPYNRENIWIKEVVPAAWFTLWHALILLAVINLFFSRRTKPPLLINMICLFVGLSFSIFIIFFKHLNF